MKECSGGICAARGFTAGGIHAGVKAGSPESKNDLMLLLSDRPCAAAGLFTSNRVKAAPIYVSMSHLENGTVCGVVANSGNANACAPLGHEHALEMCAAAAAATGLKPEDFVVASTGVIGQELNIGAITKALPALAERLSTDGSDAAATAIMTTDTKKKELAVEFQLGGKAVHLGGISKGSGMICPNLGTMLCFLTSDCAISPELVSELLHEVVPKTFNRITVDGDTSTNDTCVLLCNGAAGNALVEWKDEDYAALREALLHVCTALARGMAADGEGASRLITCTVSGARNEEVAERLAKAIAGSCLVKAAMFGADANWGRVLCAMGYSKAPFRPEWVDVSFASGAGEIAVCRSGAGLDFSEEKAKEILTQTEVSILVDVHEGSGKATCWGCDLTYDYVRINGDYRT